MFGFVIGTLCLIGLIKVARSFRHGGFGHRGFGFPLVGAAVGLGLAAGYPYWGGGYYGYGDGCLVPRRVWTPYGWRRHWINVCY